MKNFTVDAETKSEAMDKAHTIAERKYPRIRRYLEIKQQSFCH
jgi:hypothetical protein